jgi:xanthine dehydrogenase small subunit
VAGCTDVGLWVTKHHRQFDQVLDLTRVAELRRVEDYPHHIAIGAAVTLTDAFAVLVADRPQLAEFAHRFAGLPVRNSGTLGGNVANGSPIGDSMPLLIALGASVVLMRHGAQGPVHRELALEDLYTGYRQNVIAPDEVLAWIKVPKATPTERTRVYKISKRFEDDISAVCLGLNLHIRNGHVRQASIGVGGDAATPVRARKTEAALTGKPWTQATITGPWPLRKEFAPISDMGPQRLPQHGAGQSAAVPLESRVGSDSNKADPNKPGHTNTSQPAAGVSPRTKARQPRWPVPPPTWTTSPKCGARCTPPPFSPPWRTAACWVWTPRPR